MSLKYYGKKGGRIRPFTLIELLIVISIIAILTAMLLPALKKTRDSVKTISCLNRQKQTGLAVQSYLSDFSFYFHSPNDSANGKWNTKLISNDYITNGDILCCPATKCDKYSTTLSGWYTYGAIYTNDASNCISMKRYTETTKAYIFACSWSVASQKPYFRMYPRDNTSEPYGRPHLRHNNRANLYFLDGHAESLSIFSLSDITTTAMNYAADASGACYIRVQ